MRKRFHQGALKEQFADYDIEYFYACDIHVPTGTIYIGSADSDYNGEESGINFRSSEFLIKGLHLLHHKLENRQHITILIKEHA